MASMVNLVEGLELSIYNRDWSYLSREIEFKFECGV